MTSGGCWRAFAIAFAALVAATCSPPAGQPERCSNGVDDNGDGRVDCADPQCVNEQVCCAARNACPTANDGGPDYGPCARCGQSCRTQSDCLSTDAGYAFEDAPLPMCISGVCQQKNTKLEIRFEMDATAYSGLSSAPESMNTRFVLKTGVDGGAVSCAALEAAAPSKNQADANQIERSGQFNLLAFDVAKVQTVAGSYRYTQPFLSTGTGENYLVWTELWTGAPHSDTRLPTGLRMGWGCFDANPPLRPDSADGGVVIRVTMPGPR